MEFQQAIDPEKFGVENRVSGHETLKFVFSRVDFPPTGLYFKSFAKIVENVTKNRLQVLPGAFPWW